ncbi:amino acid ABC transporter substrate-binding protein [Enterococcus hulanensis]|uniref:Amino acid ABC transporter substrate-binding protein n=1 Tax=Enterococcus hulanensis TaxID=2559929 RepID=A0ABU3F0F3_9ENTE|nr:MULTISPECIES: amino acid ABC transporter substrate-binding protein [Enterococcus]MBX8936055.1 amino acid ABC transporter substrate-binding protein [Enterococcus gilvus]MDT2599988.1 amino acid ABC transporter substrate-binding protein [Enterococcus hulanensis]MDT2610062.1 amino acid ABC transporter substrate-binding protein [Enterococcus hulanensis]MDT2617870.1 amino acid ABC transporter substrate-binding protein [Enterococcus hulanensis]MDT2629840.1 amino acid ABC transporter substrate-bind
MKLKKIILGMAAVLTLVTLTACGKKEASGDDSWKTIEEDKKVTIGLDDTFVPMGFKDKDGKIVGFDVDLAKAVFKEYGIKADFQPIDWSMKENELENGTIDLIWNGYTVTKSREKKVLFTDPYAQNEQILVTKKDSGITSAEGMKDKILGAQEGSSGYEAFNNETKTLKDIVKENDATLYASFNEAMIDLENGRIDGLLIDKVYADYYLKQAGKLDAYNIFSVGFKNEDFAVGARKGDKELVKKINSAFKELQDNGKYAEISKKWFGEELSLPKE